MRRDVMRDIHYRWFQIFLRCIQKHCTIWFKPVFVLHGLMLESEAIEALHLWETAVYLCARLTFVTFMLRWIQNQIDRVRCLETFLILLFKAWESHCVSCLIGTFGLSPAHIKLFVGWVNVVGWVTGKRGNNRHALTWSSAAVPPPSRTAHCTMFYLCDQ